MASQKRLCSICARGGSKGVPGKNLRPLAGIPLLSRAIGQAKQVALFEAVAVSSDSEEILSLAREGGADFAIERPAELASDEASKLPVIQHLAESVEEQSGASFDTLVDIDVTAPLRALEDIRGAVDLMETRGVSNVITGAPARKSPYFNLVEARADGTVSLSKPPDERIVRRQDSPKCYDMNAAVYVWRHDIFMAEPSVFYPDTLLYEMPEERSYDIDTETDFEFVEFLLSRTSSKD